MGTVVSQGACPYCTSSDAYTTFDDGGYKCFSCGRYNPGSALRQLKQVLEGKTTTKVRGQCQPLPEDTSYTLSNQSLDWVHKYGITDAEIAEHGFMYSTREQLLIFPVYGDGELLMWQGRYFGNKPRHPKYLTRGTPEEVIHVLGVQHLDTSVVLTEDLLSAIKVSRQHTAMPLWGSSVSRSKAKQIAHMFDSAYLWLDYDKKEYSVKTSFDRCMQLHITPIITSLDPKAYPDNNIAEYLKEYIK